MGSFCSKDYHEGEEISNENQKTPAVEVKEEVFLFDQLEDQLVVIENQVKEVKLSASREKNWIDGSICFECNKVLRKNSRLGDDDYWVLGHDQSAKEGGGKNKKNINLTCYSCNGGKYKELNARDRVKLKLRENSRQGIITAKLPKAYYAKYAYEQSNDYKKKLQQLQLKVDRKRKLTKWIFY